MTVNGNSLLDLNGYNQTLATLNLNDGGSVQTGAGLLSFPSGGAVNVGSLNGFGSHVSSSISGGIGLPANALLTFNVNPSAPFFPFPSGPELNVPAAIPVPSENVNFIRAGIAKQGAGRMRLGANNTYAGFTSINGGTLMVDGAQPQSPVNVNSGTLGGSGAVGPIYMNGSSAVVAPGDGGPGILNCGNFNSGITASGALLVDLNGPAAGSGYSQLNVTGTVNLAGLGLQWSLGYTPAPGQHFVIISNDAKDPVAGSFNGLQNTVQFYVGGQLCTMDYHNGGKPGNDVALDVLNTPPPPSLTIQWVAPGDVWLVWPTNNPPFRLESNTNLSTANWTPVSPAPTVQDTNDVVVNPTAGKQLFYRLVNP